MRPSGRRAFLSRCCGILAAGMARTAAAKPAATSVWWRTDYPDARREASDRHRPLALVFMTATCPWCKVMNGTTFRDAEVVDVLNHKFVPVRIDADAQKHRFLVEWLKVHNLPATVIACPDGNLVNSQEGYLDPMMYLGYLRRSHLLSHLKRDEDVAQQ